MMLKEFPPHKTFHSPYQCNNQLISILILSDYNSYSALLIGGIVCQKSVEIGSSVGIIGILVKVEFGLSEASIVGSEVLSGSLEGSEE